MKRIGSTMVDSSVLFPVASVSSLEENGTFVVFFLAEGAKFFVRYRRTGALVAPEFGRHVANKLQEEVSVMKERRKHAEERGLARGPPAYGGKTTGRQLATGGCHLLLSQLWWRAKIQKSQLPQIPGKNNLHTKGLYYADHGTIFSCLREIYDAYKAARSTPSNFDGGLEDHAPKRQLDLATRTMSEQASFSSTRDCEQVDNTSTFPGVH